MEAGIKVSIITVCYNSAATIERTLKSVLQQTYDNYEYIIKSAIYLDKSLFNEIFMLEDLALIIELINLNEVEKNIIYSNIGEIYIDSLNVSKSKTKGYKK